MSKPSPLQNVKKLFGSKEQLIAKVIDLLTPGDGESREAFSKRLKYVANAKLLRLAQVGEKIKSLGGREALVAKLAELKGQAKDKDFVASLSKLSLPRLLDSVQSLSKKVKPAGKPAGKPAAKPAGKPAAKA
ncbi:MAG: hypothetical protein IPO88_01605 [Nannocystis sp.]|uniref:hypothetical protein n=1 Tax=Nannocystis sp. TaxID=1962667 RepID=UPI0024277350|nr:hypothetical protein [Nannocystis sp.]MBK9752196.1 hypothetical protein [Nannocystis sp.]